MKKAFVMYANKNVNNTLNPNFMTSFLKNAQITEFKELLKVIEQIHLKINKPLSILDIGVGDARIPLTLSTHTHTIWEKIALFVGFDNSQFEVKKARETVEKNGLTTIVKIIYFNALNLELGKIDLPEKKYDLIICTYFTPGNFKPDKIKIEADKNNRIIPYPKESLKPNKNFIKVFKSAYEMLYPNGEIFLGSVYIDTDENRKRQEEFYKKCGMTVITSENDEYTATKEGFWSERFTKEKVYKYFSFVSKEKIKFISLDNYSFAWSIIVSK